MFNMNLVSLKWIIPFFLTMFLTQTLQAQTMEKQAPEMYFVFMHTPGENWVDSLPFREQPNVMEHVGYMSTFLESNKLVMGGPFLDNSGGMMVYKCDTFEEAEQIANNDPTVKSGLLKVEVKQWYVPMKTVEQVDR